MNVMHLLTQAEFGPILEMSKNLSLVGFLVIAVWYFVKKDKEKEEKITELYKKNLEFELNYTKAISDFTSVMNDLKRSLDHNTEVIQELKEQRDK